MEIQEARREGWEEGRKQGLEEGICGGDMEGSYPAVAVRRHVGAWASTTTPTCKGPASKSGQDSAKASAASTESQTHIHSQTKERVQVEESIVRRGPEWVDDYVRRPSSRFGPYSHRGSGSAIFPILSLPEGHHLFEYVRLRWITHPYRGQRQQSRSSRRSSGRVRTGPDLATIRGKSTPANESGLLQLPPG